MLTEARVLELIGQVRRQQEARTPKLTLQVPVTEAATASPSLLQVFARFQDDPLLYATVKLRRARVEQLRRLLMGAGQNFLGFERCLVCLFRNQGHCRSTVVGPNLDYIYAHLDTS